MHGSSIIYWLLWICLCSYVTEGMFRVSHRKEYPTPPIGDPRAKASLPGEPFHSFSQKDAEETPAGAAVLCRFQMMPTAYCFAQVSHTTHGPHENICHHSRSSYAVPLPNDAHCLLLCPGTMHCSWRQSKTSPQCRNTFSLFLDVPEFEFPLLR